MKSRALSAAIATCSIGLSACAGGVTLAPHLNRESELAPAAAAERYGVVLDRASAFEAQNQKSRDVHWYRMWRASAMIGLGQIEQGVALIDQVLADIASTGAAPAQADRLRAFAYDQRARAALLQSRPRDALADLDRSYDLATELPLETRGDCDRAMMLAARSKQIEDVAKMAGDGARAAQAHTALSRQLERWSKCLAERDYPGMVVVSALATALSAENAAPVAVAPAPAPQPVQPVQPAQPVQPVQPAQPVKAAPVQPPPAPPKPAAAGVASLPTVAAQYAPVDAAPWKEPIDSALGLVQKHAQNGRGDVVIRTDGQHHAFRVRVSMPKVETVEQLVPVFRSTVVFFELSRNLTPKVERVLLVIEGSGAPISVLAHRNDVLELFQERLDAAGFAKRLTRVM